MDRVGRGAKDREAAPTQDEYTRVIDTAPTWSYESPFYSSTIYSSARAGSSLCVFTPAAAPRYIYSTDMQPLIGIQTQSAQDTLRPMGTPLTIKLTKSRSVFLAKDSLDGASTAPADVSTLRVADCARFERAEVEKLCTTASMSHLSH